MSQAFALPPVGSPPVIVPPRASTSRVMMIGLSATDISLIDLSVLARWKIKPRLMAVPGVANVTIWGQRDKQLQVQVDPARLRENGVTLTDVISTTGNALWASPLSFVEASSPGTGGFVDMANQRLSIQHVLPIANAESLASVTIVDDAGRTDEAPGRNGVAGVVRQVPARDPVHGSVEVRARVLAEVQGVPVPARPLVVVARDLLDRYPWRRGEDRR